MEPVRRSDFSPPLAAAEVAAALPLDPGFVLAHFALGNLALRQGKRKESDKYFENVLSLLRAYRPDDLLPESEGMMAGRLMEIVRRVVSRNPRKRRKTPSASSSRLGSWRS